MPIDAEDVIDKAKEWAQMLFDSVPIDRLVESFELACKNHTSSFPVNAYEVLQAWRTIFEVEKGQRQREINNLPTFCTLSHIEGKPRPLVHIGSESKGYTEMPCPNCNKEAFREKQRELIEQNRKTQPKDEKQVVNSRFQELQQMRAALSELRPQPLDLKCTNCQMVFEGVSMNKVGKNCISGCGGLLYPKDSFTSKPIEAKEGQTKTL